MPAIVLALLGLMSVQSPQPQEQTSARPSIELEKKRFAIGERVFLWIRTSRAPGDQKPIPAALLGSGRVIYTRPDGTRRIDLVSGPIDGMGINGPGDMGWKGGWTLRDDPVQLGRWTVVYEFAGYQSTPVTFTVEDLPIVKELRASFEFTSPLDLDDPNAAATFVVRNGSRETFRFVELGQNYSLVSVRVRREGWDSSFFVPQTVLAAASGHAIVPMSVDLFDWNALKFFPIVTLAPGATYRLKLPIITSLDGAGGAPKIPPGAYDVQFSTELQILIGERDGQWKDLSPLRLVVTSSTKATRR